MLAPHLLRWCPLFVQNYTFKSERRYNAGTSIQDLGLESPDSRNRDRLSNSLGDNDGHKGFRSPADEAATSVLIAECHAAHHYKLFLQCYLSSIRILFLSGSKGLRSVAPAVGAHDSSSAHGLPIPLSI
jgi:hypothetical protein